MAAKGSMAPVAVSPIRLAAVWMAIGRLLAVGSVMGAIGRCGAVAAWATIPLVRANTMTITSNRFVMLITISIASCSAYRCLAVATFRRALRHGLPAPRGAPSTGRHNQFTVEYGVSRRFI